MTTDPLPAVRPATPADAAAIAAIQAEAVATTVATALGGDRARKVSESISVSQMTQTWAITAADNDRDDRGVLVAHQDDHVVGFAAFARPQDPGKVTNPATAKALAQLPFEVPLDSAQILAFEVDANHRRRGHGSRLLSAVADTAGSSGAPGLVVWLMPDDEEKTRFFQGAGFRPAGVRRNLETGAGKVTEHLWFAALR